MIPFPLFSWPQMLLLIGVPWLGLLLGVGLILYGLIWRVRGRTRPFWRTSTVLLSVLALVCNAWLLYLVAQTYRISQEIALKDHYRQTRQQFVLEQDSVYGSFVLPKGSLINRYDPFDNGEAQRPFSLRGLRTVAFPQPVEIAGAWATVMEAYPGRSLLAKDQRLGPVHHYDAEQGWVPSSPPSWQDCRQGQTALYEIPSVPYDIQAEFLTGPPDGAQARFFPEQWLFRECSETTGMEVKPAYDAPGPGQ